MGTRMLLLAMIVGVALSGLFVALVLPATPASWHSPTAVWLATLVTVAGCIVVAARVSRPRRG